MQLSKQVKLSKTALTDTVIVLSASVALPEPQAPIQQCPSGLKTLLPTAEGYVPQG